MVNGEGIEDNQKLEAQKTDKDKEAVIPRKPINFSEFLHDLRSPLTGILGMVEIMKLLMEDETAEKKDFEWYIAQIEQEALRLRDMLS